MRKIGVIIMVVLASCEERKMSTIDTKPDSTVADSSIAMANIQPLPKQFSLDKMYEHYINPSLIAYLEKNHPAWSVPDRNTWHPQLFNKYMGDSTLVN